ncbi:unnamed protein product, partial [Prorocentrum cordatum]
RFWMAPPVARVVDALTGELVCEVVLDAALTFRRVALAAQAASGLHARNIRLLWIGRSLRAGGDSSVVEDLRACCESTVIRLVRVEPHWEPFLDRLAQGAAAVGPEEEALLADVGFLRALVLEDGLLLRLAPEEPGLRGDLELIRLAVRDNGRALGYAPAEARGDKATVLLAVGSNGSALEFAAPALQADPEVVAAAVGNDGEVLRFASEALRLTEEVPPGGGCQQDALGAGPRPPHPARGDLGFVAAAVRANGDALQYAPPGPREHPE